MEQVNMTHEEALRIIKEVCENNSSCQLDYIYKVVTEALDDN